VKLIIAIVHERDKQRVGDALLQEGMTYTKIGSTGGFLRQGNATLLIGVDDSRLERALEIVRLSCRVSERFVNASESAATPTFQMPSLPNIVADTSGGAVAFVVDVERFIHF
jgi:uncharacterized protein YaaQ